MTDFPPVVLTCKVCGESITKNERGSWKHLNNYRPEMAQLLGDVADHPAVVDVINVRPHVDEKPSRSKRPKPSNPFTILDI